MNTPSARGAMTTRSIGMLVAVLLSAAIVLVLLVTALRSGPAPVDAELPTDGPVPELITGTTGVAGGRGSIQITGDDPTEVVAELEYDRIEPLGGRRYLLTQPSAWIELDNGSWAFVSAQEGRLVTQDPQAGEPESGSLSGGVLLRRYPLQAGGARPDPAAVQPELVGEVETLNFDLSVGEISTPDLLRVSGSGIEFEGRGVRALLSEVRQRIELVVVREAGQLRFEPVASQPSHHEHDAAPAAAAPPQQPPAGETAPATASASSAGNTPAAPSGAAAEPAAQPQQERYLATFRDNVIVTSGGRQINADRLDAWITLYDRGLRPGALGAAPVRSAPRRKIDPIAQVLAAAAIAQSGDGSAEAAGDAGTATEANDPVVLTWTGVMELRPFDERTADRPVELGTEDVLLRLTAERTGSVRFADDTQGFSGRSAEALYGTTSRTLTLGGPGPATVRVDLADRGVLTCGRLVAGLNTGVAHVPGPGRLDAASDQRDQAAQVTWTDSADFVLEPSGRRDDDGSGGAGAFRLQMAVFNGSVEAARGIGPQAASISGGTLRAEFASLNDETRLIGLVTLDQIDARDGRGGRLLARDRMDVAFDRASETLRAEAISAVGAVMATQGTDRLSAELIEADLEQIDGSNRVVALLAEGAVSLESRGRVSAGSERMTAAPEDQRAEFSGGEPFVRRGPTEIAGDSILLDGGRGLVRVIGAGSFNHTPSGGASLWANWSDAMEYDDASGFLLAEGSVEGRSVSVTAAGVRAVDTLSAERMTVRLASAAAEEPGDPRDAMSAPGDTDRPIELVILESPDAESPASVESRRYRAANEDTLERLTFLSSTLIEAQPERGMLIVPEPGTLVIADRAAASGDADASRGDALFQWEGSMRMDRAAGMLEMQRAVRLTHLRRADGLLTDLECERLQAQLLDADTGESSAAPFADLERAQARGAVYLRSGTRELIADELDYNAIEASAVARPLEGNVVRMFEAESGAVTTASLIEWDMLRDRIQATDVGPVTSPD